MRVVAVLRLAVPYTGIILSTRERAGLRDRLLHLGVSQISSGSRTFPGGYAQERPEGGVEPGGQFATSDKRTKMEVVRAISKEGFQPSFCTACYRVERTGKAFMASARPGDIKNFCLPNSILSLKEYILDYGPAGDRGLSETAEAIVAEGLGMITDGALREATRTRLRELEEGKRDLFF